MVAKSCARHINLLVQDFFHPHYHVKNSVIYWEKYGDWDIIYNMDK
jgi:hypothetical protein